jgi:hypothetical protein
MDVGAIDRASMAAERIEHSLVPPPVVALRPVPAEPALNSILTPYVQALPSKRSGHLVWSRRLRRSSIAASGTSMGKGVDRPRLGGHAPNARQTASDGWWAQ